MSVTTWTLKQKHPSSSDLTQTIDVTDRTGKTHTKDVKKGETAIINPSLKEGRKGLFRFPVMKAYWGF